MTLDYLDMTPKTQSIKENNDNLVFINLNIFCSFKDTGKRMKKQVTDWEKILWTIFKIYKELSKFNNKKIAHLKIGQKI